MSDQEKVAGEDRVLESIPEIKPPQVKPPKNPNCNKVSYEIIEIVNFREKGESAKKIIHVRATDLETYVYVDHLERVTLSWDYTLVNAYREAHIKLKNAQNNLNEFFSTEVR